MHCDVAVLDMPLLDTRRSRDLIGTLISDIVLQLLSYVAETEREFIRRRQREGIEAARANGVHLGRVAMTRPDNYENIFGSGLPGADIMILLFFAALLIWCGVSMYSD